MDVLLWIWESEEMPALERERMVVGGVASEAGREDGTVRRSLPAVYRMVDTADVSRARREIAAVARALGVEDVEALELVAGELATNCVEHRSGMAPARLRIGRYGRRLVIETWNACAERPDWRTRKNGGERVYRVGGHGLLLCRVLSASFRRQWLRRWGRGYVRARAEFELR